MTAIPPLPGHALILLLLQMAALLTVGRLLGELMKRVDQPPVIGELLSGIVLGPSILGRLSPAAFAALFPPQPEQMHLLEVIAWLGMVLLLLLTGLETDVRLLRHLGRPAFTASVFGMVVPFALGFAFGEWLPATHLVAPDKRHLFAAFFATAMSISAMPVIAKILMDLELTKRDLGVVILSAGVVDDTTGWVVLSMIVGLAGGHQWSWLLLGRTIGLTLLFLVAAALLFLPAARSLFQLVDDRFRSRNTDLALIVVLTFLAAAATEWIGVHAVFGAFVVGCVLRQVPRLRTVTVHRLEATVLGIFAPVFFGVVGLKVDLNALGDPWLLLLVLAVASAGKIIGCTAGGLLGGLSWWESLSIGMGMNARGAMGLVVALIGLTAGILNAEMYSMVVAVAIITSFLAPISLRFTAPKVPISDAERARLAAITQAGFVDPATLRMLLPTAGGPNALAAARLAASFARGAGATLTALYVDRPGRTLLDRLLARLRPPDLAGQNLQAHLDSIRAAATASGVSFESRRLESDDTAALVRREASHGTDLLLVGAGTRPRQALRGDLIGRLVNHSPCHVAIVRGQGETDAPPRRILVPFDGSYFSRAAVELAVLIAEGSQAAVTVLYVLEDEEGGATDDAVDTALDEGARRMLATTMLATASPILMRTRAKVNAVVEQSPQQTAPVLRELANGRYDLLLVGAESNAIQHRLSVGWDVERLVEESPCAVVVVVPKIGPAGEP